MRSKLILFLIVAYAICCNAAQFEWESATPESQGISGTKLAAMRDELIKRRTSGLLVIRNDKIICEWYGEGQAITSKHGTASLAKAVVGGLGLALAMSEGCIELDEPAAKFIPQWREDPLKSRITIRQLGSHTSGLEDAEEDNLPHNKLSGWKGDFWQPGDPPRDAFTVSRDAARVLFEPGTQMEYSNPGIAMLTYATTAALWKIAPKDLRTLLRERVMQPIGVANQEWSVGYGQTPVVDGLPLIGSWGGAAYTARALARVGRLMLRAGEWEGRQLLKASAVHQVTRDVGTPGNGGIGWWSNNDHAAPELPRDAYWGSGAGHQILLVIPSLNLLVVRNGAILESVGSGPDAFHVPLRQHLFKPLVAAITNSTP